MAGILLNQGEVDFLAAALNKAAASDLVLRLFMNDVTPAETDTEASYTEATFSGYAAVTLTGANWTITEGEPSLGEYAQQVFTSDADQSAQQIYGYYVARSDNGRAQIADRFPAGPYPIANNGDHVNVTPRFSMA